MKRIKYIDIARGIAIFLMVFGHSIVHSLNSHLVYKIIYSFHIPLFFIISGFTFNSSKKEFGKFFTEKFKRIIIPYLVWSLLFLIPYYIFGKNIDASLGNSGSFNIFENLFNILYGVGAFFALKQNTPLWFLPALFTMEIIFFFICKEENRKRKWIILLLLFILGIFTNKYFTNIVFPFGINTFLNLGFFFYMGFLFKEYNFINKITNKRFFVFLMILIGLLFGIINDNVSCVDYYYGNIFFFYLSATLLSTSVLYISKVIGDNKAIEYIGKNTLGILIFHKLIIVLFQNKIPILKDYLLNSNFFIEIFIGLSVTLITIVLCDLIIRIINYFKFGFLIGENNNNLLKLDYYKKIS